MNCRGETWWLNYHTPIVIEELGNPANNNLLKERPEAPPPPVPQAITRRQCAVELKDRNLITLQEALAMTKYGDVPAMISQLFIQMSENDRLNAEINFAADTYLRSNPLLTSIMLQSGHTEEEIDDFFRSAIKK